MIIKEKTKYGLVKFKDLREGDVFESLTGRILMKITPTKEANVVMLKNGHAEMFYGAYVYDLKLEVGFYS